MSTTGFYKLIYRHIDAAAISSLAKVNISHTWLNALFYIMHLWYHITINHDMLGVAKFV